MKRHRFTIYLAAAAIFAATITQAHAQEADPLAAAAKAAATPAPATATPRPAAVQPPAATPQPRAATATAAPRSTPAPAAVAPRESVHEQLAHGHFVQAGDLASMAGKKIQPGTFLTGQFKCTGSGSGGRKEFTDGGLFGGKTRLLIRFPVAPDPRVLTPNSSTKWERPAPLRVESVSSNGQGVTVYATDVTP